MVPAIDASLVVGFAAWRGGRLAPYATLVLIGLWARGTGERIAPSTSEDVGRVLAASCVSLLVLPWVAGPEDLASAVALVPMLVAALLVGRATCYAAIRRARREGLGVDRVLIVGAGETGRELARVLAEHPSLGLQPVGFVDEAAVAPLAHPLVGGVADLPRLTSVHAVDVVLVAEAEDDPETVAAVRACAHRGVRTYVVPRLFEVGGAAIGTGVDRLWSVPVVRVGAEPRPVARFAKRAVDLVLAGALLVVLAPLFAIVAVAVACSSPGPVLFRQARVTKDHRRFEIVKFRTLPVSDGSDRRWGHEGLEPTTVGRLLRRMGLDELPQLVNVIRGDMSLVGPRPERPFHVERFGEQIHGYADRHRVPAGMTGWAQIHGLRGDTSIRDRVRFDNEYIDRWSLWGDLLILGRTLKSLAGREGS